MHLSWVNVLELCKQPFQVLWLSWELPRKIKYRESLMGVLIEIHCHISLLHDPCRSICFPYAYNWSPIIHLMQMFKLPLRVHSNNELPPWPDLWLCKLYIKLQLQVRHMHMLTLEKVCTAISQVKEEIGGITPERTLIQLVSAWGDTLLTVWHV